MILKEKKKKTKKRKKKPIKLKTYMGNLSEGLGKCSKSKLGGKGLL